jgi:hypothetical protein
LHSPFLCWCAYGRNEWNLYDDKIIIVYVGIDEDRPLWVYECYFWGRFKHGTRNSKKEAQKKVMEEYARCEVVEVA